MWFDDEAASPIDSVGAPFGPGAYQPAPGSLSAFDGMGSLGEWELRIVDNFLGDSGTLDVWAIDYLTTGTGDYLYQDCYDCPLALTDADPIPGVTSSYMNVTQHGSIYDLDMWLDLDHTYMEDLDIYLMHDGTTVQLFDNFGGGGDDLTEVWFDDEAASPIDSVGAPFGPGAYQPAPGSLSAFDSMDIFGEWELRIVDNMMVDVGELIHWRLVAELNTPDPIPEPTTMLLLGSGLVGLAGFRRRKKKKK